MRIKIKDLQQRETEFECSKDMMFKDLVMLVSKTLKLDTNRVVLVSRELGLSMEDMDKTLKQIGIRDGEVLDLIFRTDAGRV
ncbi:MAG: ubiquitin-like domain-containing protein [Candidatus Jordarchaeaceae archaeon]